MSDNAGNEYCVYELTFPSGKKYIGMSKNPERRWKNGEGYITNKEMYKEIQKVGWNNVRRRIIEKGLKRHQAQVLEKQMITVSESVKKGYNKTNGGEASVTFFSKHVMKILHEMHVYHVFDEWREMFLKFSDDEEVATCMNIMDVAIQRHKDFSAETDPYVKCVIWLWLMREGINGRYIPDINYWSEQHQYLKQLAGGI